MCVPRVVSGTYNWRKIAIFSYDPVFNAYDEGDHRISLSCLVKKIKTVVYYGGVTLGRDTACITP